MSPPARALSFLLQPPSTARHHLLGSGTHSLSLASGFWPRPPASPALLPWLPLLGFRLLSMPSRVPCPPPLAPSKLTTSL